MSEQRVNPGCLRWYCTPHPLTHTYRDHTNHSLKLGQQEFWSSSPKQHIFIQWRQVHHSAALKRGSVSQIRAWIPHLSLRRASHRRYVALPEVRVGFRLSFISKRSGSKFTGWRNNKTERQIRTDKQNDDWTKRSFTEAVCNFNP